MRCSHGSGWFGGGGGGMCLVVVVGCGGRQVVKLCLVTSLGRSEQYIETRTSYVEVCNGGGTTYKAVLSAA